MESDSGKIHVEDLDLLITLRSSGVDLSKLMKVAEVISAILNRSFEIELVLREQQQVESLNKTLATVKLHFQS